VSATFYASVPPASQTNARFIRDTLDVFSPERREAVALTGYRHTLAKGTRTYGGGEPTPPPWGITRCGSTGKLWAVWHLPTGLAVTLDLPTLNAAKALCLSLDSSTATEAWNLPHLAAQPFGKPPQPGTEAHGEAVAVWRVLRAWRKSVEEMAAAA